MKDRLFIIAKQGDLSRNSLNSTIEPATITGWLLFSLLLMLLCVSNLFASNQSENTKDVILFVLESLKSMEHLQSGSGIAQIEIKDKDGTHDRLTNFMFKDTMSRSDMHLLVDGKQGLREAAWAVGRKCSIGFNPSNVRVEQEPARQFYRRLGFDYHPETFLGFERMEMSLIEALETVLESEERTILSSVLDDEGILRITSTAKNDRPDKMVFFFDTKKGYRPIYHEVLLTFRNASEWASAKCRFEWEQFGSEWYIKTAVYDEEEKSEGPDPHQYKKNTKIIVKQFRPNVEIDDSAFTLAGFDIPQGLVVLDRILGINYKYGSGLRATEKLEGPMFEAEFFKSIARGTDVNELQVISGDQNTHGLTSLRDNILGEGNAVSPKLYKRIAEHKTYIIAIVIIAVLSIVIVGGKLTRLGKGR